MKATRASSHPSSRHLVGISVHVRVVPLKVVVTFSHGVEPTYTSMSGSKRAPHMVRTAAVVQESKDGETAVRMGL